MLKRAIAGFLVALALTGASVQAAPPVPLAWGRDLLLHGLPPVLSTGDGERYRQIFALQIPGKWRAADQLIARLEDRRLIGHVLAQRYLHPTAYRSTYRELRAWLEAYADHHEAPRIYKLAKRRQPKGAKAPRRPISRNTSLVGGSGSGVGYEPFRSSKRLTRPQRRRAAEIKRRVRRNVRNTRFTVTEKLLRTREVRGLLDRVEIDEARAAVAAGWFYFGDSAKAFDLAAAAAKRSGASVPSAHWIAGLAAWRLGKLKPAAHHFEQLAGSARATGWTAAAGAYWAARAHLRLRQPGEMSRWLGLAAAYPRTFYGLLAHRALGLGLPLDFRPRPLSAGQLTGLQRIPGAQRALALLQIGERERAEGELKSLDRIDDPVLVAAVLQVLERGGFPRLALDHAERLSGSDARGQASPLQANLYPIPPWRPTGGYIVDRALVYALMRQESRFNPRAKSKDGARGLMQLMPGTAGFIARREGLRSRPRGELFRPEVNIDLGQRYLAYLLDHDIVRGDLFRLMAAYNGGPGIWADGRAGWTTTAIPCYLSSACRRARPVCS